MKKTAMLVIGLLMAVGVMFAGATPSSSGNAAAAPIHLSLALRIWSRLTAATAGQR